MKVCARRFNLYLALALALAGLCGCQTDKKLKDISAVRVHLQADPNQAGTTSTISVVRNDPVAVNIGRDPILTEANVVAARVIDSAGGFAVEIQFDENAALMLEQYTASNPGRHLAIFAQWGEKVADGRWIAAPLITHRISNGLLAFTPDFSRTEADRFVRGLNDLVAKTKKKGWFQ
jgi:preprotein translocase subunit SecD